MIEAAPGWVALLAAASEDDETLAEVAAFCPPCASREFTISRQAAAGYV